MPAPRQERLAAVSAWVNEALPILGLVGWRITVSKAPSSQDSWAEIDAHGQATEAELFIGWDLWAQTPERIREVLVHELVHLITCRADDVVDTLEEPLGKTGWAVWYPNYENAAERAVDHLARLLAPLLPLPRFPRG